ncbi:MAG: hydroxymethylbilane synthase [Calditrichia bacterium]
MKRRVVIGTRGSELALYQTNWVRDRLMKLYPEVEFLVEKIKTTGDIILDSPLSKIGDKGLFTKELDRALLDGRIDFAVHSMKDVPTQFDERLAIIAVTDRWDVRDAFLSRDGTQLSQLPEGAVVATGSLRRRAQLLHYRPDLRIVDIRGNVNTRLKKFDESNWHGMILACAGLERLNFHDRITEKIGFDIMLPAVGQGCFAVMGRRDDAETAELLQPLNRPLTAAAVTAERELLRVLEGGCQVPLGAYAYVEKEEVVLEGCVADLDGKRCYRGSARAELDFAADAGRELAEKLIKMGADQILEEIRLANKE